jgi:hypothetical protein
MATRGKPSKRAVTVLALLRQAPEWRVYFAFFTRASRITLAGRTWTFSRSIVTRDSGLFSQLGLSVEGPARTRERLVKTTWPRLRDEVCGAGFEMFSDFAETAEFAHFHRPLESVAEATPEWRFINELRLGANGTVRSLPKRALRPETVTDKPGVAHRLFASLGSNRALMSHLSVLRITRESRARIARHSWRGSLAVMGDAAWLQATVDFWPVPREENPSPETLDLAGRMAAPMLDRGYREFDPGEFSMCPIGTKRIESEFAFLSTLKLSDLLAPGVGLPAGEGLRRRDRAFYDILGAERGDVPCKRAGCGRGAIKQSAMCRVHHFEMIQGRPCSFDD